MTATLAPPSAGTSPAPRRRSPLLRGLWALGELLITGGVVVLLFVAYLLWWTNVEQSRTQQALTHELELSWAAPATLAETPYGSAYAKIRIPRLGASWQQVVVEGVSTEDLKKGPGHYPQSADPGAAGNVVLSGHRTTYGEPFHDLDRVHNGDLVVLETRDAWFTYRTDSEQTVLPTAVEVLRPIPPGFTEAGRYLTLTTCTPLFSASHRLVLHGDLLRTDPKGTPGFVPRSLRTGVVTVADLAKAP